MGRTGRDFDRRPPRPDPDAAVEASLRGSPHGVGPHARRTASWTRRRDSLTVGNIGRHEPRFASL